MDSAVPPATWTGSPSVPSAAIWSLAYSGIGYLFAGEVPQVSDLVASILFMGVAVLATLGFGLWTLRQWRRFQY